MEVPDHNGVGYSRGPQGDACRSRGLLQRHHTIQTCDDAYVSQRLVLIGRVCDVTTRRAPRLAGCRLNICTTELI